MDVDPMAVIAEFWPDITLYDKQEEVVYSVFRNDETYVPAANEVGKDYVASLIALVFFLTRQPCRVVTTSAKDEHLRVLWGEINARVRESKYPLEWKKGGVLICQHQDIKKVVPSRRRTMDGKPTYEQCPLSYLKGMVAGPDSIAAMQGHHVADLGDGIPRTLFISDESSSVSDDYYKMASTWATRMLVFGNPWPCQNFFYRNVKAGDLIAEE